VAIPRAEGGIGRRIDDVGSFPSRDEDGTRDDRDVTTDRAGGGSCQTRRRRNGAGGTTVRDDDHHPRRDCDASHAATVRGVRGGGGDRGDGAVATNHRDASGGAPRGTLENVRNRGRGVPADRRDVRGGGPREKLERHETATTHRRVRAGGGRRVRLVEYFLRNV